MHQIIQEKDTRISFLEKRVEDLEQYTRREDVIITGIKIDRKFAEVAQTAVDGERQEKVRVDWNGEIEKQVLAQLAELEVFVESEEISACHTLGKPDVKGQQKVILRFVSRKSKVRLMNEWEKLRGSGIYVNEHLTKKNADIAKAARDLRRAGKIKSTHTRDCKVVIKKNDGKTIVVRDLADLSIFSN